MAAAKVLQSCLLKLIPPPGCGNTSDQIALHVLAFRVCPVLERLRTCFIACDEAIQQPEADAI
jgi:hypothetical protein